MEPAHLSRSLQSLRSICLKKINSKDLIDDKELLGLFRTVREVILKYQQQHQLPELKIVLERLPEPATFEKNPNLFQSYRLVHALLFYLSGVVMFFVSPFAGIGLILLITALHIVVLLYMKARRTRINAQLRQIADACSAVEMVVTNNETYQQSQ
jgi:hypothetical protein